MELNETTNTIDGNDAIEGQHLARGGESTTAPMPTKGAIP